MNKFVELGKNSKFYSWLKNFVTENESARFCGNKSNVLSLAPSWVFIQIWVQVLALYKFLNKFIFWHSSVDCANYAEWWAPTVRSNRAGRRFRVATHVVALQICSATVLSTRSSGDSKFEFQIFIEISGKVSNFSNQSVLNKKPIEVIKFIFNLLI